MHSYSVAHLIVVLKTLSHCHLPAVGRHREKHGRLLLALHLENERALKEDYTKVKGSTGEQCCISAHLQVRVGRSQSENYGVD